MIDGDGNKHLILDWETCGNGSRNPQCAVPSFGAIVFDPNTMRTFDELVNDGVRYKFHLNEQFEEMGRTYDQDVINFWMNPENADAKKRVIDIDGSEISLKEFGARFEAYLLEKGYDGGKVWTRGNDFDIPILYNVLKQNGVDDLFPWWNVRDIRTEIDCVGYYIDPDHKGYGYIDSFPYPDGFVKHVEVHDCARDILMLQYGHSQLQNLLK